MKRLSKTEALKIIRRICFSGSYVLKFHGRQRSEARNVDMQDILAVIEGGFIKKEAEPDIKTGRWIYNVEGETPDGDKLRICIDIEDENNRVNILTVIKK